MSSCGDLEASLSFANVASLGSIEVQRIDNCVHLHTGAGFSLVGGGVTASCEIELNKGPGVVVAISEKLHFVLFRILKCSVRWILTRF